MPQIAAQIIRDEHAAPAAMLRSLAMMIDQMRILSASTKDGS